MSPPLAKQFKVMKNIASQMLSPNIIKSSPPPLNSSSQHNLLKTKDKNQNQPLIKLISAVVQQK